MGEQNPRVSNNLRDFVRIGFDGSFDHAMVQVCQNFVKDVTNLFEKMLDTTRGNPVNDSNYDELFEFATKGFLNNQRTYKIRPNSLIVPLNFSTDNISISIDPVVPGFDKIRHFIKLDDNVLKTKLPSTLLSIALERFRIFEIAANRNPGEVVKFDINGLIDNIKYNMLGANPDGSNSIIPVSYCVPTVETPVGEKKAVESLNSPEIINLYTVLDKDDLYRTLLLITLSNIDTKQLESLKEFNTFTTFFRELLSKLLVEVSSKNFISRLLISEEMKKLVYENMRRSSIGSISKYYNNVSHTGVRGFVINKVRYFLKHSTKASSNYSWSNINQYQSYRNSLGVISGTRSIDILFNYVIGELLGKQLFDPKTPSGDASVFEFITSTSMLYIVTLASLTIGGSDYLVDTENLAGILTEDYDKERKNPSNETKYIDSVKPKYTEISESIFESVTAMLYGSFTCKYIWDFRKRISNTQHITNKEADFVRNILTFGSEIYSNGFRVLNEVIRSVTGEGGWVGMDSYKEDKTYEKRTEGDIRKVTGPKYEEYDNVKCRFLDLESIYAITRYFRSVETELNKIGEKFNDDHPISGGQPRASIESAGIDKENNWAFGKMFSNTTPNLVEAFIAGSNLGGNIKTYCDNLVSDVKFATESADTSALTDIYRRTIVLGNALYKNVSSEDDELIDGTLKTVMECLSTFESVNPEEVAIIHSV